MVRNRCADQANPSGVGEGGSGSQQRSSQVISSRPIDEARCTEAATPAATAADFHQEHVAEFRLRCENRRSTRQTRRQIGTPVGNPGGNSATSNGFNSSQHAVSVIGNLI